MGGGNKVRGRGRIKLKEKRRSARPFSVLLAVVALQQRRGRGNVVVVGHVVGGRHRLGGRPRSDVVGGVQFRERTDRVDRRRYRRRGCRGGGRRQELAQIFGRRLFAQQPVRGHFPFTLANKKTI